MLLPSQHTPLKLGHFCQSIDRILLVTPRSWVVAKLKSDRQNRHTNSLASFKSLIEMLLFVKAFYLSDLIHLVYIIFISSVWFEFFFLFVHFVTLLTKVLYKMLCQIKASKSS